ncbi:MAG TPA: methyl-accepting chemotaxis protein [Patescibacteria group bacterium]|nr:methyl-accepting chemotaxis protein [Patescibacteria group bacterium]
MNQLKYKLIAALVFSSLISVSLLASFDIYRASRDIETDVDNYKAVLYEQFDRTIKLEVETAISLVQDIYNQQQKGVLTEAAAKKQAADLIRNLRFDNGNYFWIDTTEGVNVVLLGREVEGKSRRDLKDSSGKFMVQELIVKALAGGGYVDYSFPKPNETEALPKRGYAALFKPYNWVVGTGNWVDDIEKFGAKREQALRQDLVNQIQYTVGIALLAILLAAVIAIIVSKRITGPIVAVGKCSQEVACGDLSGPDLAVSSRDEVGQIAESFNHMKDNLRQLITQLRDSVMLLSSSAEELTAGAQQSADASNQVAQSITNVAAGADKQLHSVDQVVKNVNQRSAAMDQMAKKAEIVTETSQKAANIAQMGSQSVNQAIRQMNIIEETVTQSAVVVTKLGERSKEIGQIIETISGIAGQTNLLALNAAIEAARAGEQGRGFAVVAEEIRKLSEQTQQAAKQIEALIREIQSDTGQAVDTMENGTREVRTGSGTVRATGETFNEIVEMICKVGEQVEDIAAMIQEVAAGGHAIIGVMENMQAITQDTAMQTESVSAATEEQSATMEEIAHSSRELAKMADELQTAIKQFKV